MALHNKYTVAYSYRGKTRWVESKGQTIAFKNLKAANNYIRSRLPLGAVVEIYQNEELITISHA